MYILIYLFFAILLAYLITKFVIQRIKVDGSSMEPNIKHKSHLLINKLSYRLKSPKRFDIVVFPANNTKPEYYIKRIIALPKETVQIKNEAIYIDDKKLNEDYGLEPIKLAGIATKKIKIPNHHYFVLGDNRNDSLDSRHEDVGLLHRNKIIGKAWIKIWAFRK